MAACTALQDAVTHFLPVIQMVCLAGHYHTLLTPQAAHLESNAARRGSSKTTPLAAPLPAGSAGSWCMKRRLELAKPTRWSRAAGRACKQTCESKGWACARQRSHSKRGLLHRPGFMSRRHEPLVTIMHAAGGKLTGGTICARTHQYWRSRYGLRKL